MIPKKIPVDQIKDLQIKQYFNAIIVSGTVPKSTLGGTLTAKLNLTSSGDFLSNDVTGKYTTLVMDDESIVDDGTNHLSCRITDSRNKELFDDFIPLDLFLTPGRVRTLGVLVDAAGGVPNPSSQMFFPKKFSHLFSANNDIIFEFKNDSDAENTFNIAFFGERIKSTLATGQGN